MSYEVRVFVEIEDRVRDVDLEEGLQDLWTKKLKQTGEHFNLQVSIFFNKDQYIAKSRLFCNGMSSHYQASSKSIIEVLRLTTHRISQKSENYRKQLSQNKYRKIQLPYSAA